MDADEARERGACAMWTDDELSTRSENTDGALVCELAGVLSPRTAPTARTHLRKQLLDHGRLVVDVSALRVSHPSMLTLFPTVLAAAGGWPLARMVLAAPPEPIRADMVAHGHDREILTAPDRARAIALLECRPDRVRRLSDLPPGASASAYARAIVEFACSDWGIPAAICERLTILTTELVENAEQHTSGAASLRIVRDRRGISVGVRDHSNLRPSTARPPDRYGLRLIQSLSDAWGVVDQKPVGKVVWARVRGGFDGDE